LEQKELVSLVHLPALLARCPALQLAWQVRSQLVDLVSRRPLSMDPNLSTVPSVNAAAAKSAAGNGSAASAEKGAASAAEEAFEAAAAVAGERLSNASPEPLLRCLAAGLFLNAAMLDDDHDHDRAGGGGAVGKRAGSGGASTGGGVSSGGGGGGGGGVRVVSRSLPLAKRLSALALGPDAAVATAAEASSAGAGAAGGDGTSERLAAALRAYVAESQRRQAASLATGADGLGRSEGLAPAAYETVATKQVRLPGFWGRVRWLATELRRMNLSVAAPFKHSPP